MAQRRLKRNMKSKRNKTRRIKKNKTRKYRGGQSSQMYSLPFLTSLNPVGISPSHKLY
jgi:hypothetical protein